MEALWDKISAIVAASITAMGGYYVYDRKITHDRLSRVEAELAQSKMDIRVIEVKFVELKEDTEEIKSSQKEIISILTKR